MHSSQLPTELISQIITSAASLHLDFHQRSSILRSFSLVSPEWQEYAQANLVKEVALESERALKGFLEMLEEKPELGRRVKRMRVWGRAIGKGHSLEFVRVLRLSGGLKELILQDVEGFEMKDLMEAQNLRSVSFIKVNFSENIPSTPFTHPTLRHLSIVRERSPVPTPCRLVPFLTPDQLPALRILGITSGGKCTPEEYLALKGLLPQLDLLSIDSDEFRLLADEEIKVAKLYNLSIGLSATLGLPQDIPIENLRLRWNERLSYEALTVQAMRAVVAKLKADSTLKSLKTILLPLSALQKQYKSFEGVAVELKKECEKRKVHLVDEAVGEMEQLTVSEEVIASWTPIDL